MYSHASMTDTAQRTKPKRDRNGDYDYNGWRIETLGGFMTNRHYEAHKALWKGDHWETTFVWAFRLKEVVLFCDKLDLGESVEPLYLKPLYY